MNQFLFIKKYDMTDVDESQVIFFFYGGNKKSKIKNKNQKKKIR